MIDLDINEGISLIKEYSVALRECYVLPVASSIFKLNDNIKVVLDKNISASYLCSTEYGVDPICINSPIELIAMELDRYVFTTSLYAKNVIYVTVSGSINADHIEQAISKATDKSFIGPKFYFNSGIASSCSSYILSVYQQISVQHFPVEYSPGKVFGVFGDFKKCYLGINKISSFERQINQDTSENGYTVMLGCSLDPECTFVVFKWA